MPDKERGGAAKVGAAKVGATKGGATKGGAKGVERKPSTYVDKVQVQCCDKLHFQNSSPGGH